MAEGAGSAVGTGGMVTKLRAARAMLTAGIPMLICHGRQEGVIVDAVHGEDVGTRFEAPAGSSHGSSLKLWIGLAEVSRGSITLDAGAAKAVLERGASVLPVGVVATEGSYTAGDVIRLEGSLAGIIQKLNDDRFFRCSKSMIINIDKVERLRSLSSNRIDATMEGGEHILISRTYASEFRRILKGV